LLFPVFIINIFAALAMTSGEDRATGITQQQQQQHQHQQPQQEHQQRQR
jgi:hypothetical protein